MKIKIGTRKSKLAMIQTEMAAKTLQSQFPDIKIEIVPVSTKGDMILDKPLSMIGGKGIFVSEIERMLENKEIDIAVHSAKDLPSELGENLEISGVLPRGNYRDALVTMPGAVIKNDGNFRIGTGSLRRQMNLKRLYPNVTILPIRGNVDTRLEKLRKGEYDGIILAAAGLERMKISERYHFDIKMYDYDIFLPAPCQGIIAIESRKDDPVSDYINKISHKETMLAFETERKVMELLNADCSVPLGAYSEIIGDKISMAISKSTDKILSSSAPVSQRFELARELVSEL